MQTLTAWEYPFLPHADLTISSWQSHNSFLSLKSDKSSLRSGRFRFTNVLPWTLLSNNKKRKRRGHHFSEVSALVTLPGNFWYFRKLVNLITRGVMEGGFTLIICQEVCAITFYDFLTMHFGDQLKMFNKFLDPFVPREEYKDTSL